MSEQAFVTCPACGRPGETWRFSDAAQGIFARGMQVLRRYTPGGRNRIYWQRAPAGPADRANMRDVLQKVLAWL